MRDLLNWVVVLSLALAGWNWLSGDIEEAQYWVLWAIALLVVLANDKRGLR